MNSLGVVALAVGVISIAACLVYLYILKKKFENEEKNKLDQS